MSHRNYQKPPKRKGMVCNYCSWNPDGTIREARYVTELEAKAALKGETVAQYLARTQKGQADLFADA